MVSWNYSNTVIIIVIIKVIFVSLRFHLGLSLLCSKFNLFYFKNFPYFSPITLFCIAYYSKVITNYFSFILKEDILVLEMQVLE